MAQSLESLDLMEARLKKSFKIGPESILDEYFKDFPPKILEDGEYQGIVTAYFLVLDKTSSKRDLGLTFFFGGDGLVTSDNGRISGLDYHQAAINRLHSKLNNLYTDKLKNRSGNDGLIHRNAFKDDTSLLKAILNWIEINIKEEDLKK